LSNKNLEDVTNNLDENLVGEETENVFCNVDIEQKGLFLINLFIQIPGVS